MLIPKVKGPEVRGKEPLPPVVRGSTTQEKREGSYSLSKELCQGLIASNQGDQLGSVRLRLSWL